MDRQCTTEDYVGARCGECGYLRRHGRDLSDKLRGFDARLLEVVEEVIDPKCGGVAASAGGASW